MVFLIIKKLKKNNKMNNNYITYNKMNNHYMYNDKTDIKWKNLGIKFTNILEDYCHCFCPIILSNYSSKHKIYNITDKKLCKLLQELQYSLDDIICGSYPFSVDELNTEPKIKLVKVFYSNKSIDSSKKNRVKINYNQKYKINKLVKEQKDYADEFINELQSFINYLDNDFTNDFDIVYKNKEHKINKISDNINDTIRKIKRYIAN